MKKFSLLIICLSVHIISYAQTTFKFPTSLNTGSELIEIALENTFISLFQDYALEDKDGQRFGRGGESCFNSIEYFGISTNEGVLFFNDIMEPWASDEEFTNYKEAYKPFLISSKIGLFGKSEKELISINDSTYNNFDNKYYFLSDSLYNKGLFVNKSDSLSQNGWFVWITLNQEKSKKLSLNIYKRELPKENINGNIVVKDPNLGSNIMGALYITPVSIIPGMLQFKLEAIICHTKDTQDWVVVPIGNSNEKKPSKKSLTPLDKSKNEK